MKEWALMLLGGACLVALVVMGRGCGGGGPTAEERVDLGSAERTALESAARAVAEAAADGDTAALDAGLNPNLPPREARALRAALTALKGKPVLTVAKAEGVKSGGAVATLEGGGRSRSWYFDRIGGAWKLSRM